MFRAQKNWGFAYQNLQSELAAVREHLHRVGYVMPESMKLAPTMNPKNTPGELSNCIKHVSVIRDNLSSRPGDFNIKIASMLSERFESDAKSFYEDFTHHMGDVPYYPE